MIQFNKHLTKNMYQLRGHPNTAIYQQFINKPLQYINPRFHKKWDKLTCVLTTGNSNFSIIYMSSFIDYHQSLFFSSNRLDFPRKGQKRKEKKGMKTSNQANQYRESRHLL